MKVERWSLFSLLLIAGLSFLLVGKSAYSEDIGAQAGHSKVWVGTWLFDVDWDCDKTLEVNKGKVVLDSKGNFKVGGQVLGTWTGTSKKITIKLNGGCNPVYVGTMKTKGNVAGTMKCSDGSGCWDGTKSSNAVEVEGADDWTSPPEQGNAPQ